LEQRIDRTAKERPEARDLKIQMHKRQLEVYKKLVPNNAGKWRMG
jgi:dynactin-6